MNVIAIVLVLIILVVLMYTYYYFNPTLLNNGSVINLLQTPQLSIGLEPENASAIRYYYDGWLRVDANPDFAKNYVIFNRGNDFIVSLTGHTLSIYYGQYRDDNAARLIPTGTGVVPDIPYKIMDIARNFPFQKWTYFCINVDGNTMDVYLDGKLTKSVNLPNPPAGSDAVGTSPSTRIYKSGTTYYDGSTQISFTSFNKGPAITVGNNSLTGKIARFRREVGNMDPQSVWNTYILGPGSDDSNGDYHATVALTKNNKVRRSLKIF